VTGHGHITFSLAHLSAAFLSLTLLLQPVAAALLAWWLLNEPLRAWQSIGALMVLWGLCWRDWRGRKSV
jgi:drug/metabolite transporter (DMT)-like permease